MVDRISYIPCKLKKGVKYTASFDIKYSENVPDDVKVNFFLPETEQYTIKTFIPIADCTKVGLYFDNAYTGKGYTAQITNLQVEIGSAATSYEPYKQPQTLTLKTPNGLPGIPVKSGGNYTDSAGQQWVCDEIDLSEEERVRRIDIFERVTFTIHPNYEVEGSQLFRSDIKINDDELSGIQLPCMCNKMMKAPTVLIENKTGFYAAYGRIFARIKDVSDADTFNQMMADNVFLVQRPDPIVTPLSPEEIAAYRALHTYAPNTTITNDAGCGMSLTYIADTQRYIDKKIAAISAAMIGG